MRHLNWHGEKAPELVFQELADYCRATPFEADVFGKGASLNAFEARVAALLGKEAAVFLPSGVMAQQIALRIYADQTGQRTVGVHHSTHVETNEQRAYAHLHGLQLRHLGGKNAPILAHDLRDCGERLGTLLVELPLRRIGGILPEWAALQELLRAARERGLKLQLDGARLWEAQVFYDRPLAEICAGFDSVYVSFYKGLGGIAGAMLLGSAAFIAEARVWQRRHGGNLTTLHPLAVSAQMSLEKRLPKMKAYRDRAVTLAAALKTLGNVVIKPEPPQTNMFHFYVNATQEKLEAAHRQMMERDGVKLCTFFLPSDIPGWTYTEVVAGDATLEFSDREALERWGTLLAWAAK